MKTNRLLFALSLAGAPLIATPALGLPAAGAPAACTALDGAVIVHDDGTYLGKIADELDPDSIFNELGRYGSNLQSQSIWNELGRYGSELQPNTPFNDLATRPPMIIKGEKLLGYLTVNRTKQGGIHPVMLGITCYDVTPRR